MKIQTDLNYGDWMAFANFIGRPKLSHLVLIMTVPALVLGFLTSGLELDMASMGVGCALAFIVIVLRSRLQQTALIPSADGPTLGIHDLSISDDGIRSLSKGVDTLYQWDTVRDIRRTNKHVFVMVDTIDAVIIPRRNFADSGQCEAFLSEIEKRMSRKHA